MHFLSFFLRALNYEQPSLSAQPRTALAKKDHSSRMILRSSESEQLCKRPFEKSWRLWKLWEFVANRVKLERFAFNKIRLPVKK